MDGMERLQIYEDFFHKMQYANIGCREDRIIEAVNIIFDWSYAHRQGNGEYTEEEQQAMIDRHIERMKNF